MVKSAFIKLRGQRIGAVAWDESQQLGFFGCDKKFIGGKLNVAHILSSTKAAKLKFSSASCMFIHLLWAV